MPGHVPWKRAVGAQACAGATLLSQVLVSGPGHGPSALLLWSCLPLPSHACGSQAGLAGHPSLGVLTGGDGLGLL